jgi:hypothetical protein
MAGALIEYREEISGEAETKSTLVGVVWLVGQECIYALNRRDSEVCSCKESQHFVRNGIGGSAFLFSLNSQ